MTPGQVFVVPAAEASVACFCFFPCALYVGPAQHELMGASRATTPDPGMTKCDT